MSASASSLTLRDYQEDTVSRLLHPPEGITRSLAVLATGAGKTIVFASLLDRFLKPGERALVLAHREELLTQARDKIAFAAPLLHVEIEQAASFASRTHPEPSLLENRERSVVVGSVQTLRKKRLEQWASDTFRIVIVDEAHHATSGSYVDILTYFGCLGRKTRLVGVTATPGRSDGIGLGAIFQEIAVDYGIRDMIARGYLVPIKAQLVESKVDLSRVRTTAGDYAVGDLEAAVNTQDRNHAIVAAYEEHADGMQAVTFCAGVEHAKEIARLFNERSIPTEAVWGEMERSERTAALSRYQLRETRILTNMGVLTEGWDAPETQCVILARPTQSRLLLTQMIGRGTRLHPGKEHMLVLDVADVVASRTLATAVTLAGLPSKFKPKGGSIFEMAEAFEEIDPRLHAQAMDREMLERILKKVKAGMSVAEIDLFATIRRDDALRAFSALSWLAIGDERWSIKADTGRTYEIHVDALGRYVLTHVESKNSIVLGNDKRKAFLRVDSYIHKNHRERLALLDASARWRSAPASEKQRALIEELSPGEEIPPDLTKGDAAMLLDALMIARRARKEGAA